MQFDSVEPVKPHSNLITAKEPNQLIHARVSQCNLRRWDQIKTTQISPHDGRGRGQARETHNLSNYQSNSIRVKVLKVSNEVLA